MDVGELVARMRAGIAIAHQVVAPVLLVAVDRLRRGAGPSDPPA